MSAGEPEIESAVAPAKTKTKTKKDPPPEDALLVEDFLGVLASHLPNDVSGNKFDRCWTNIAIKIQADGKKKMTGLPETADRSLARIRSLAPHNTFDKSSLKHFAAKERAYCLILGHVPNLVILDVDGISDLDDPRLANLVNILELPYTRSFSGNGFHFYAMCEDIPPSEKPELHGVPRDAIKALLCGDLDHPDVIGDIFVPSLQHSRTGNAHQNFFERPSIRGSAQYVHNWKGSIPTVSFEGDEGLKRFIDMDSWGPDTKKQATDDLIAERQKEKDEKYNCVRDAKEDLRRAFTADQVLFILKHVSCDRSRNDGWLQVGAFLKFYCDPRHTKTPCFENGLDVWDMWSQDGKTYDPAECQRTWDTLVRSNISFGSLIYYARTDGDRKVVDAGLKQYAEKALRNVHNSYSQMNVAQLMTQILGNCILCDSTIKDSTKKMYVLNEGGIWESFDSVLFCQRMQEDYVPMLQDTLNELSYEIKTVRQEKEDGFEETAEKLEQKKSIVAKAHWEAQQEQFQNNVFAQAVKMNAYKPNHGTTLFQLWNQPKNVMWIVPFSNICYDMKTGVWRPCAPDEYVNTEGTTGYEWPVDDDGEVLPPTEECLEFVWEKLSSIFIDEQEFETFLTILSGNLCAQNLFREILFVTGNAANGKGVVGDIMLSMLGNLAGQMDVSHFQNKKSDPTAPAPNVANCKYHRFTTLPEPAKEFLFRSDIIKLWNGDDVITCRTLHSKADGFELQSLLMFQSNDNPGMSDPNDPGVKRRLKCATFGFKFVDTKALDPSDKTYDPELDPDVCKLIDPSLKPKFRHDKQFGMALFWLMGRIVKRNIRQNPGFAYEFDEISDAPKVGGRRT